MSWLLEIVRLGLGLFSAYVIIFIIALRSRITVIDERKQPAAKPKRTGDKPAREDEAYDGAEFAGVGATEFVDDDTWWSHL